MVVAHGEPPGVFTQTFIGGVTTIPQRPSRRAVMPCCVRMFEEAAAMARIFVMPTTMAIGAGKTLPI